jgi:sigma-B regulation protein RsbU (phosphoserine phosphatase)
MTLNRIFYIHGEARQKHFEFSTRRIHYLNRDLIMVIIYDVTDIEQKKIELERKQRQIERDLKAASGIQQSLLPDKSPDIPNVNIAWRFEPCQEIGGDIFNIQEVGHQNVGIYMLDVCGHGVPAALIAVSLSQLLQNSRQVLTVQQNSTAPASVLDSLNMAFPFERFESYFSIVYAVIDYKEGIFTYSCGGHPPPVILSCNEPFRILDCHGPVIGIDPNKNYTQAEIKLNPGDKIVLYTDGIVECRNPEGEMFGKNRFYQSLEEHRGKPAQQMADTVYEGAKRFMDGSSPDDDVSIMVVAYG